jgi:hypothetical protein
VWVGKLIFLLVIFEWLLFHCTSRTISRAWGSSPYILNHSTWNTYDENINKCSVISSRSVMGRSTLNLDGRNVFGASHTDHRCGRYRANTFVQSFYPTHKSSQYRVTFPLGPRAQRGVNENMTVLSDSAVKDLWRIEHFQGLGEWVKWWWPQHSTVSFMYSLWPQWTSTHHRTMKDEW